VRRAIDPHRNGERKEDDKEAAGMRGLVAQRLLALFFGGALLLNFPLLALWDRDATMLGLPLFPCALFAVWAVLIGLTAWIVERHGDGD
jgi:hypothetical protein